MGDVTPAGTLSGPVKGVKLWLAPAAALVLAGVVAVTYEPPELIPSGRLAVVTDNVDRVRAHCSPTVGGGYALCNWTVHMAGGRVLDWPWSPVLGSPEEETDFLGRRGPVSVWLSGDRIQRMVLDDGTIYIRYDDAADEELERQWLALALAGLVSVLSLASVGLGVRRLVATHASDRLGDIHGPVAGASSFLSMYLLIVPDRANRWPAFALGLLAGAFWVAVHFGDVNRREAASRR